MRLRGLVLVVAAAVWAPPAGAAVVTRERVCQGPKTCNPIVVVTYRAAPGEANEVVVSYEAGTVVFADRAPLAAPRGCSARSDREVVCTAHRAYVLLGDAADVASGEGTASLVVRGGPGDDRIAGAGPMVEGDEGDDTLSGTWLNGGAGADTLTGSEGNDVLYGGDGPDALTGGAGDDVLAGDYRRAAPDVLDGGPGSDTVSYYGYLEPVRIDIASQTGGDGDRLSGFENAQGGSGDDVLVGDGGPNALDGSYGRNTVLGGAGDDTVTAFGGSRLDGGEGDDDVDAVLGDSSLVGGPGDDRLSGGFGIDTYSGGDGDDFFEISYVAVRGGWQEKVRCGGGDDVVLRPLHALVRPDCEWVTMSDEPGGERLRAYPRRMRLALPRDLRRGRVELRLDRHRRPFTTIRFLSAASVRLRIPRAIRRLDRDPLRITILIAADQRCWTWVVDLRPP